MMKNLDIKLELALSLFLHVVVIGLAFVLGQTEHIPPKEEPKKITMIRAMSKSSAKKSKELNRAAQVKKKKKTAKKKNKKKTKPTKPVPPKAKPKKTVQKAVPSPIVREKKQTEIIEETQPSPDPLDDAKKRAEERRKQLEMLNDIEDERPEGPKEREKTSRTGSLKNKKSSFGNDPDWADYEEKARKKIKSKFVQLQNYQMTEFKVTIEVVITSNGALLNPKVVKSSGNADFDAKALSAVRRTRTLESPPSKYQEAAENGVWLVLTSYED